MPHLLRASQEGIAFSFRYGIDVMREIGLDLRVIRAGEANLFLSPVFRETLATLCDADIQLFDTDGSLGAARGAALGAGYYASPKEAFATLDQVADIQPRTEWKAVLEDAYENWKEKLIKSL
jgi:xylulokinase